ncbi:cysI [Acrasis kona]|uniref:CysI n=1 Tax=Acrasis kona TaxID=1008807 RepID=A0AAW2ZFF9_9EUKA
MGFCVYSFSTFLAFTTLWIVGNKVERTKLEPIRTQSPIIPPPRTLTPTVASSPSQFVDNSQTLTYRRGNSTPNYEGDGSPKLLTYQGGSPRMSY